MGEYVVYTKLNLVHPQQIYELFAEAQDLGASSHSDSVMGMWAAKGVPC